MEGLLHLCHLVAFGSARCASIIAGTAQVNANKEERLRYDRTLGSSSAAAQEGYPGLQSEMRVAVESFATAMVALVPDAKPEVDKARSNHANGFATRRGLFDHCAAAAQTRVEMGAAALRHHPMKTQTAVRLESIMHRLRIRQAIAPEPIQRAVSADYAVAEMLAALVECAPQGFMYRVAVDRALARASAVDPSATDALMQMCLSRGLCFRLLRILCWQSVRGPQTKGDTL